MQHETLDAMKGGNDSRFPYVVTVAYRRSQRFDLNNSP